MRVSNKRALEYRSGLTIHNVEDSETIHQRCLLVRGRSVDYVKGGDYLEVRVADAMGSPPSVQVWPMGHEGAFTALVKLSAGSNELTLSKYNKLGQLKSQRALTLHHVPLTQLPPLHLAVMVAKDSPLLMDCPPARGAGFSSTHNGLDAAIAKLRTAAYMWQALTAEDMRAKGLGRRSFRLEEEWAPDTTSVEATRARVGKNGSDASWMSTMPKVHVVRSEHTVAEMHNKDWAYKIEYAEHETRRGDRDAPRQVHHFFEGALTKDGRAIWESVSNSRTAGLILDSQFVEDEHTGEGRILGHSPFGCSNGDSVGNLATYGSHLCFAWPRFFEEIAGCLTDATHPGDRVANEPSGSKGYRKTMWEQCAFGQAEFLTLIGNAFGAGHTPKHVDVKRWRSFFLAEESKPSAKVKKENKQSKSTTDNDTPPDGDSIWDIRDALYFRCLPHFRMPGDKPMKSKNLLDASPQIAARVSEEDEDDCDIGSDSDMDEEGPAEAIVEVSCDAGIFSIDVPGLVISAEDLGNGEKTSVAVDISGLRRDVAAPIRVLGMNGREARLSDAWRLFNISLERVRIPGSSVVLRKQSVRANAASMPDDKAAAAIWQSEGHIEWSVLFAKKDGNGAVRRANRLELRVGCVMDGAVVHYDDGTHANCGPALTRDGHPYFFGGHQSATLRMPRKETIRKIEVNNYSDGKDASILIGACATLSSGAKAGAINDRERRGYNYDDEEDGHDEDGEDDEDDEDEDYDDEAAATAGSSDEDLEMLGLEATASDEDDGEVSEVESRHRSPGATTRAAKRNQLLQSKKTGQQQQQKKKQKKTKGGKPDPKAEATLTPPPGHVVVGLYGTADKGSGWCKEFGIITAPAGVGAAENLPPQVFDMPDFDNSQSKCVY